jgi:phage antirepressor YoqD-like protein
MNTFINTTGNGPVTMSTRDIAELVDKRHDNVMRDTKAMLDALELPALSFEGSYVGGNGKALPCYNLPRDLTMTLVTGYSIPLRKKVIDRLDELERGERKASPDHIDFSDPRVILGAFQHLQLTCSEQATVIADQAQQIATMAPAVDALEQIADAHGSMSRTEAAKHLGVPPQTLCKWMRTHMWTYRRAGAKDDLAYQAKINAGYLEHKVTTGPRPDGTEWIGTQVRVTPRGLTVLAKAFPKPAEAAVVSALRSHMAKVA